MNCTVQEPVAAVEVAVEVVLVAVEAAGEGEVVLAAGLVARRVRGQPTQGLPSCGIAL